VLSIHVMDFVEENKKVTNEILRVLKNGGQFVITYPSEKEGARLGFNLLKDSIRHNTDSGKRLIRTLSGFLTQVVVGAVYLPLLLRPKKRFYLRHKLEAMIAGFAIEDFQIEEDAIYQDFIVYGRK